MQDENVSTPGEVYGGMVADIIRTRPTTSSTYRPTVELDLTIVNRRAVATTDDLEPAERYQMAAIFHAQQLGEVLADGLEALHFEVAQVIDETGTLRFRLYGCDYGVGYLFPPEGLDVVAAGFQHDLEHWSVDQRNVFAAMDRADRNGGHGFRQPLAWCWTKDECWDEDSADLDCQSREYLQARFAEFAAQS